MIGDEWDLLKSSRAYQAAVFSVAFSLFALVLNLGLLLGWW